jgi:hypothetical protein
VHHHGVSGPDVLLRAQDAARGHPQIKVLYLVGDYIDFKLADDLKGLVLGKLKDIFHF